MGGRKRHGKQVKQTEKDTAVCKQSGEDKRFVNLLHVYTIYKQKFRRLSKGNYEEMLRHGCKGKRAALKLCKEFMTAKEIPSDIDFEKNIGFLSLPRLMPLIALLAERSGYKFLPSLVSELDFRKTPERFHEKFAFLMVYGFWFLGRVISDSLSVKDQVNRGNMFNFRKGDMGFWWAGVRILDWNSYVFNEEDPVTFYSFVSEDPPKYRFYTNRAIINMHQHPLYFLSEEDWQNYTTVAKSVRHYRVYMTSSDYTGDEINTSISEESSFWDDYCSSGSDISSLSSEASVNTLASRESID